MDNRIATRKGDITQLPVDAVVNAANSSLMGGGGVDGAIHRAGGKQILEECLEIINRQGRCATGQAVITSGGRLPARYVIHTVGPVWGSGKRNEPALLANCYQNSLQIAVDKGIKTIAFPNISTGVYHFPKQQAAQIAVKTVTEFIATHPQIEQVIFTCFDDENFAIYQQLLKG